jgi:hypothetical protein
MPYGSGSAVLNVEHRFNYRILNKCCTVPTGNNKRERERERGVGGGEGQDIHSRKCQKVVCAAFGVAHTGTNILPPFVIDQLDAF